ncbi:MAG: Serine protease Do-like HtrA [Firmicutes bacterium ADurb.BinA205]|nr:MAG: Serine protease Do-like HtrA [Firmicutes bacterium ADurb.BinA205]HQM00407.1 trypsin-like peptidase domain-containing protein [Ruminococcus flavefaciens]
MREEYEYTVNNMEENSEVNGMNNNNNDMYSYYNGFSADGGSPKKPKKHIGAKIAASLMAMTLVSAGSIGIYRNVAGVKTNNATASSVENAEASAVENAAEKVSKKAKAENVSIIKPEDSEGGILTTEEIVDKVLPSVVGIESTFTMTTQNNGFNFGDFGSFGGFGGFDFGQSQQPQTSQATATGTGVAITEDGYIVTNAHVIYDTEYGAGLADSISVLLNDEKSYDAEVIGYDTDCDLAVLKIKATGLTAAEFGDSDDLKLGESVIAIGNPLGFELMDTVTSGIVSGINREITINDKAMTLLQTDAAINSGNSGGPLINKYGQVIGINSSKMSASYSETSIEGIGFAIPSNEVAQIVDDIMEYGYVTGKPQLGISCQDVTETISKMYNLPVGVYVTTVTDGSAADKAGLQSGDVITAVDGEEVKTSAELNAKKNLHKAGETLELTYMRSGNEEKVTVTLDQAENKD